MKRKEEKKMHFNLNNLRGEKDIKEYFQRYKEIKEWGKSRLYCIHN